MAGAAPTAAANATAMAAAAKVEPPAASPTKAARVVARLHNVPKYALRGEVAALLAAAGVRPQDCATVVDDRYSFRHWVWELANDFCCACSTEHPRRLTLASEQQFNKVQAIVNARKRIGTRVVKLSLEDEEQLRQEEENHKHPNRIADEFRMHSVRSATHAGLALGRGSKSVVMGNLPDELNTDQVERFFHGFQIPPSGIKHVKLEYKDIRTPLHKRLKGERRKTIDAIQRRVLVKFRNELEAMRAIRERQGAFLDDMAVELTLLQ
eukprot:SM000223S07304  [mRNA]  locus=s223:42055:43360:- [translate_table: standard]